MILMIPGEENKYIFNIYKDGTIDFHKVSVTTNEAEEPQTPTPTSRSL